MPTYKGNAGHLMQHWTLCEILEVAGRHTKELNFIDAYAMAPLATEKTGKPGLGKDHLFNLAESRLPTLGGSASAYEQAWYKLTSGHCPVPRKGYPNSAAFVEQVWKGKFSMLLCEIDRATCQEIKPWLQRVDKLERCKATELSCRDWQERFKKGLPSPADVGLADGSLTLVLFDPNMYYPKNVAKPRPWILYPKKLEMAASEMKSLKGGTLIQLSTYSAMDAPGDAVIASVNQILVPNGFQLIAVVRIDGNMMSLVYARKISWAAELADTLSGFYDWFSKI